MQVVLYCLLDWIPALCDDYCIEMMNLHLGNS